MERVHVPGVAIGLIHDGIEQQAGLGVTNVDHPLDVTADTLFQIGAVGKTFTATALLRLVEDGRAELDAPVRTYFPEFRLGDESVAAIRELIFEPLGVERSCFTAGEAIIHRVAVGHVLRQGQCMVARPWSLGRTVHPSGAS